MNFGTFLIQLFADGEVALPSPGQLSAQELADGDAVLREHEAIWRLDQPAPMPDFDITAGRWGAVRIFRACQFVLYRDVDAGAIEEELAPAYPGEITPEVSYSVDLTFRYLPQLVHFARTASAHDPLVDQLQQWGREWPLSSVGMSGLEDLLSDVVLTHPGLRRQYADRVIALNDQARLSEPRVQAEINEMLGIYPDLAPQIAKKITSLTPTTT